MHYFFHVHDGRGERDASGQELPDLGAARNEAERLVMEVLSKRWQALWTGGWSLDVTDAEERFLFAVHLSSSMAPWVRRQLNTKEGETRKPVDA